MTVALALPQHDVRDPVADFVRRWSEASEIGAGRFIGWLGVAASKFYNWRKRYGRVNEYNGWVPRDFRLEEWEKQAIIAFHLNNRLEGYRRLTFRMLDVDIVAVSPASVWRVLSRQGLLQKWNGKPSLRKNGLRTTAHAAPALAYRRFLHQHQRPVLLFVQRSGWFQPLHCPLGIARANDGSRHRDHSRSGQGEVPRGETAHHLTMARSSSPRTLRSSFGSRA